MTRLGAVFLPQLPPERLGSVAQAADETGLEELWLWEDCFRESGIAAAAAALAGTSRVCLGIGLLPSLPLGRYGYVDNGSLEGAALALLSRKFFAEIAGYLGRITYVDLADLPGYMDEFVGASFLPHTSPELLRVDFS